MGKNFFKKWQELLSAGCVLCSPVGQRLQVFLRESQRRRQKEPKFATRPPPLQILLAPTKPCRPPGTLKWPHWDRGLILCSFFGKSLWLQVCLETCCSRRPFAGTLTVRGLLYTQKQPIPQSVAKYSGLGQGEQPVQRKQLGPLQVITVIPRFTSARTRALGGVRTAEHR